MKSEYVAILMTAPSADVAAQISESLVKSGLAACVSSISPIQSLFTWQGQVNRAKEVLLIAKTRADLFGEEFISTVKSAHPYDVPEIIALPIIGGSQDYLDWIREVTKKYAS